MIFVLLCILATSLLFVFFQLFKKFGANNRHGIVVNYFTAGALGFALSSDFDFSGILQESWLPHALILGVIFISLFNVMALTAQINGISVASVANKMSVVIPVVVAVYLYGDTMPALKVLGIIIALVAVFLASKKWGIILPQKGYYYLPVILFFGSGVIDTYLKYVQHFHLTGANMNAFIPVIFIIAGIIGAIQLVVKKQLKISRNSFVLGVLLGITNYFSIYFILKALDTAHLESSVVFSITNVGVVATSSLISFLFFKEKLVLTNWLGIGLALLAIIIITLA